MTGRAAATVAAAALLTWLPPAPLQAAPAATAASYEVSYNGLPFAVVNERFETRNGTYRIVSESTTVGLLALFRKKSATLVSSGVLTKDGLRPLHFEGNDDGDDTRRVTAEFDWQQQRLSLTHDGITETVALAPGTQDRLSLMYQFMFAASEKLTALEVAMTNGRKVDRYRYIVSRNAEIDTPLGRMRTLHLVKERQSGESTAEVWLAPQYHFFPVKVLIVEKDGARYEQLITRLDIRP